MVPDRGKYMGEKIAAIVLAAGEGKRMGSGIPKQYMLIKSRPLVYYALKAFEESAVDEVILVTGEDEIDYCKDCLLYTSPSPRDCS